MHSNTFDTIPNLSSSHPPHSKLSLVYDHYPCILLFSKIVIKIYNLLNFVSIYGRTMKEFSISLMCHKHHYYYLLMMMINYHIYK